MKGEKRRGLAGSLFAALGLIFVDKDTSPPQADLIDLITLCGGMVCSYQFYVRISELNTCCRIS